MARVCKRARGGPYEIKVGGESQWICGCGLSRNQPFCDGSHKLTRTEEPGKLYWYDDPGNRLEAADLYAGIREA
jgi:CDGSH-type Zn-finger protein